LAIIFPGAAYGFVGANISLNNTTGYPQYVLLSLGVMLVFGVVVATATGRS